MTRLRQENPARRQYLAELRALIAGLIPMTSDCKSEVARFILRYPDSDAFVVLIGDSFSDPMPVHCLLRHRNGQRLADSNRICKISGQFYEWWYHRDRLRRGVVLLRIHVRDLISGVELGLDGPKLLLRRRVHD